MSTYKKGSRVCVECGIQIDINNSSSPWHSQQIKAKNQAIEKLLNACGYLAKEYCQIHGEESLPSFIDEALNMGEEK